VPRRLLQSSDGIALPIALGVMVVVSIALVTVMAFSSSSERTAEFSSAQDRALALAEAAANHGASILATSPTPLDSAALPSSSSPQQVVLEGGTAEYWGTLPGGSDTWTITGRSTVKNPTRGADIRRTVTIRARVASTAANPAWNYLFSDDPTACLTFDSSVQIKQPVYSRGDLCMDSSAQVLSSASPVHVAGKINMLSSAWIGSAGSPLAVLNTGGGCRYGVSGGWTPAPCGAAEHVYATTQSSTVPTVTKPPVNLQLWYEQAKPGPSQNCTTGSFPGGFDTGDGSMNRSLTSPVRLMPGSPYDCRVMAGASTLGRIAWSPGSPGTLTVQGTIFFDGDIVTESSDKGVYAGSGTIYASGRVEFDGSAQLCGAYDYGGGQCNWTTGAWNPNTDVLYIVAGTSTDTIGFEINSSSMFQGGVYAVNDFHQDSSGKSQGPVIARRIDFDSSSGSNWTPFTFLPPGAPMEPPKLVQEGWGG
jgi:Tfp pilus assembly protein PilX